MFNLYDYVSDSRIYKKFQLDELLFVEYHCVIEQLKSGYWTPCNYLIYILTGKKKWRSLDREYFGHPGEAFFMKKGAYIAEQFLDEEFCSLIIFLPDDFIRTVMNNHQLRNPGQTVDIKKEPALQVQVNPILHSYFHSVLSYFPQQQPPPDTLLKVKFEEFVINIMSNTQNPALATYFEQLRANSKIPIREIMETNFSFNMNLEEFARLSRRSLSTFHRDFKKEFKTSPSKWLTQRRLEYAKLLLETTDKTINEIVFESGFENSSHFIRIFKARYGKTPLKFRHACL